MHRYYAEENAMCCGYDQLTSYPIINFGTFEQHDFLSLSLPYANLKSENAKYRARLLFSLMRTRDGEESTTSVNEHFAYGILFRHAFRFSEDIVKANNERIHQALMSMHHVKASSHHDHHPHTQRHRLMVSMHIRHASESAAGYNEEQDQLAWQCLNVTVSRSITHNHNHTHSSVYSHTHSSPHSHSSPLKAPSLDCVLLLASDRNESFTYWMKKAQEFQSKNDSDSAMAALSAHCHTFTVIHANENDHSEPPHAVTAAEHGPFAGERAMYDLELLSRGDVFIGSTYLIPKLRTLSSSFSLLIAALRATHGHSRYAHSDPGDDAAVFLPECKPLVFGRRVDSTKQMFAHPETVTCQEVITRGVLMPDQCPYKKQQQD
jgi:hypothetical protein